MKIFKYSIIKYNNWGIGSTDCGLVFAQDKNAAMEIIKDQYYFVDHLELEEINIISFNELKEL